MSTDPDITSIDSTDPSPYIRTYAKDVAALAGKSGTGQAATVSVDTTPTFGKKEDTLLVSDAPSKDGADLSQLQRDVQSAQSPKESAQAAEERIQDLGNAASSGLLQSVDLPSIRPGDIIPGIPAPAPTPPPIVDEGADREAVLARLRAKVAGSRPASTPLMPSSFSPIPAYEPPPAPLPPAEPVAPTPPQVETLPEPAPFHSFSSDFADRIDEQHASTFSVLAAEDNVPKARPVAQKKKFAFLPILAGIILVIAGAGGVFVAYRFMTAVAPIASTSSSAYLIVPDAKIALSGTGPSLLQALAAQANQPIPTNNVLLTYISSATTTKQGTTEAPASGGAFLTALNLPAPDILLRNIDPSSMIGIENDGSQTRAFFILRVDSYESTFAGMLQWESSIATDLGLLYPPYPAPVQTAPIVATSTATTTKNKATTKAVTPPAPTLPFIQPGFVDEVVSNHNARALKDSIGRTILIYGYADNQTLVITRDEAAFTLLLARLQANQQ